jgi:hypothetical protein
MGKLIENLPVRLTPEECASKAFELGRAIMEIVQKKQDLKEFVSDEKQKIDEIQASIEELAAVLEQRQEMRAVECHEQFNHEDATVEVIRKDTFEIVRVRPMTEQDRQLRLYNQKAVNEIPGPGESFEFVKNEKGEIATSAGYIPIESVETPTPGDILDQVREDPIPPAPPSEKRCNAELPNGKRCKAESLPDRYYCEKHLPNIDYYPDEIIEEIPPPPIISSDGIKEDEAAYIQEIQKGPRPRTRRPGSMRDQCAAMVQPRGSKRPRAQCLQPALLGSEFCEWHDKKSKKNEVKTMADDINPEVNPDDPIEKEREKVNREDQEREKREREERKEDRETRRDERKEERGEPHPEQPIVYPEEPES